jgi:hypothetical protein
LPVGDVPKSPVLIGSQCRRWASIPEIDRDLFVEIARRANRAYGVGANMKMKLFGLVAACALLGAPVAATASPYVVTLEEVGSNVVATAVDRLILQD